MQAIKFFSDHQLLRASKVSTTDNRAQEPSTSASTTGGAWFRRHGQSAPRMGEKICACGEQGDDCRRIQRGSALASQSRLS